MKFTVSGGDTEGGTKEEVSYALGRGESHHSHSPRWSLLFLALSNFIIMHTVCVCECVCVLVVQSCLTLWNLMDCSLPGSSAHGILQERILEWVAIPFFGAIFPTQGLNPGLLHCR